MRPFRPLVLVAAAATSLGLSLPATAAPPTAAATGVTTDQQGRTAVDVSGEAKAVAAAVSAVGGQVVAASEDSTRACVPLTAVEALAGRPGVTRVGVASQAMLANEGGRAARSP